MSAISRSPKSCRNRLKYSLNMSRYFAERPSLALCFENFVRELRDGDFAPTDALQMVNAEFHRFIYGFIVLPQACFSP